MQEPKPAQRPGKTFHGIIVDQGADCELIEPQLRMHYNRVAIAARWPGAFEGISQCRAPRIR